MADNPIRCVVTYGLGPGQLAAVKPIVAAIEAVAAATPVGAFTPVYSADGDSVELTFAFASHDDLDTSVSRLGPQIEVLAGLTRLQALHVYGELSAPALAAFQPFQPVVHAYAP
ncbi:hypothetical protein [Variovorax rhizosphaerae]|uniref:Antibiotic biosynthesis monooxygenase n=1 Tax=Variovorax rhizosphaerae TaxID=1836200 RepID=A0ABU8WK04_9BURK